ncbi:MAG: DUF4982 domain-containing protein [Bacteroidales bacterium]|nr:DUF4982 domain-containing protein [Bacteroidales bacterium]
MPIYLKIVTLFFLLGSFQVQAQLAERDKILREGNVRVMSFDEDWSFLRFGLQPDGNSIPEPDGISAAGYDDAKWRKLNIPHDWAIEGPFRIDLAGETGKLPYRGIGWYRKHFILPKEYSGKKVYVDFDGAMAYAQIWLNGQYVGTWPYGYSSFRMDLTPYLHANGTNVMAVRLDTEKWESRWYPGAGIYRHVWLLATENLHIAHWGTFITTPQVDKEAATVKLCLNVENNSEKSEIITVATYIHELNVDQVVGRKVAETGRREISLKANSIHEEIFSTTIQNPKLWSIETPERYVAVTNIMQSGRQVDSYTTFFGIRSIEFTARNGFLLNGKRVKIQGTCNHHDLGALGAAINTSALKRQLMILKEMGCNSLRTSHNPPAPELLELADQMGFLVWDEAFDTWKTGKRNWDYNKLYDEWHEKDLKAMVHRDRNHPSVFIWSIGNEVMDQQNIEMTKHLADIVKREDPTRPVSNGYNDPDNSRQVGSVLALDIMGVNYFFSQQPKWDQDPRYANMPTIGSETSSCVTSRGEYFFGTEYKNWQISSYDKAHPDWGCNPDEQFRVNARFPHLLGEYVWTGFDYLGEPTPYYSDEVNLLNFRNDPQKRAELEEKLKEIGKKNPPSRSSYFGIIDLAGFPKDRFYLYQSQWRPELPMAHILPHWNWPERIDSITPVHVYSSGDEAELFLNNQSQGRIRKVEGQDFRFEWNQVKYQPGELKVVVYKNGEIWATNRAKTTGQATTLKMSADKKAIKADGSEYAFITVDITDNEGNVVPRTHPEIEFSLTGPGEIVATDNGNAIDYTPFTSQKREAYNGKVLVIIRGKKGAGGQINIQAHSSGLKSGSISVSSIQ